MVDMARLGGVDASSTDERARRAVKAFRTFQPTLSAFARVLTRDKSVRVEMDAGSPRTDGRRIYMKPPIKLGDEYRHDRSACDRRDPDTLQQTCKACQAREEVLIKVYHEVAHIAYDSFAPASEQEFARAIEQAVREHKGYRADKLAEVIDAMPSHLRRDYMVLAKAVSEFLPIIVNALEDARVNQSMYAARKGTKVMMEALCRELFVNGVEQSDHSVVMWKDYELNAQAIIGVFCKASDYVYRGYLRDDVADALDDAVLTRLTERGKHTRSASEVYGLSFEVLERLRELGYCKLPEDPPEEEPQDDGEGEKSDDSEEGDSDDESEPEDSSEQDAGTSDNPGEDEESDSADEPGSGAESDEGPSSGAPSESEPSDEEADGDETEAEENVRDEAGSAAGESADEEDKPEESAGSRDQSDPAGDSDPVEESDNQGTGDIDEHDDAELETSHGEEAGAGGEDLDGSGDGSASLGGDDESGVEDAGSDAGSEPSDDLPGEGPSESPGEVRDGEPDGDSQDESVPELSEDVLDTGADDGYGGTEIEGEYPEIPFGTPERVTEVLKIFGDHDEKPRSVPEQRQDANEEHAINKAIIQGIYFEQPSLHVSDLKVYKYDDHSEWALAWEHERMTAQYGYGYNAVSRLREMHGIDTDLAVPESILGPALLKMRRVFTDNQRAAHQRNMKSGRISQRVLGRRAWDEDERLFTKKRQPGKKSYFVVIGIDVSGSTAGMNLALAKRAAMAQAELCNRMGIDFAVYAHSAKSYLPGQDGFTIEFYEIKAAAEPWNDKTKFRLAELGSDSDNLDGHSIEFYRKLLDQSSATDKILLYYTDGKMPAANAKEELEVMLREFKTFEKKGYTLLGVGIRTDSPRRHGLDTVEVNDDADIGAVVSHLQRRLVRV